MFERLRFTYLRATAPEGDGAVQLQSVHSERRTSTDTAMRGSMQACGGRDCLPRGHQNHAPDASYGMGQAGVC